jgi:hypothetical protein
MPKENIERRSPVREGIQEDQQTQLVNHATEIRELKEDLRELFDLVRMLAGFVSMPVSGTEEEKAAIEFETRLGAILEKHARERHMAKRRDGMEGNILI